MLSIHMVLKNRSNAAKSLNTYQGLTIRQGLQIFQIIMFIHAVKHFNTQLKLNEVDVEFQAL